MPCPLTNFGKPERDVLQELMVMEGLDSTGEAVKGEAVERLVFTNTGGPTW